jgi:hypothetical protein
MLQTVEAEVDVNGTVRVLEPLHVTKPTRALLTLIEDRQPEHFLLPEITTPDDRARMIDKIVRSMQANPIPAEAPRFTREELHDRR